MDPPAAAEPFFTIGHSTRSIEEFIALLREAEIGVLVDVRTMPRSRTNPQFNQETLPEALRASGILYEHLKELGGLRGRTLPDSPNGFWENQSFRNYADYALGSAFRAGLARLVAIGSARRAAIMCAEAVWWQCHRRIMPTISSAGACRSSTSWARGMSTPPC